MPTDNEEILKRIREDIKEAEAEVEELDKKISKSQHDDDTLRPLLEQK